MTTISTLKGGAQTMENTSETIEELIESINALINVVERLIDSQNSELIYPPRQTPTETRQNKAYDYEFIE
jgi:hypothetical protein